jgi:hypothetical protein
MREKFYIDLNLVFGVENFGAFLEKVVTLEDKERNDYAEFAVFLEALIQTVAECDPRWQSQYEIGKAWENIKDKVLLELKTYFQEPETASNLGFNMVSDTLENEMTSNVENEEI